MAEAHFTGIPTRLAFDRRSPHIGRRISVRSIVPLFTFARIDMARPLDKFGPE